MCSAIHNQDFTLVEDYIAGLQALLYLQVHVHEHTSHATGVYTQHKHTKTHTHTRNTTQAVKELASWSGQSPPTTKHQKGKVITPKIKEIIGRVSEREATILPRCMVNNYNMYSESARVWPLPEGEAATYCNLQGHHRA